MSQMNKATHFQNLKRKIFSEKKNANNYAAWHITHDLNRGQYDNSANQA